jgi:hypothetical protein
MMTGSATRKPCPVGGGTPLPTVAGAVIDLRMIEKG